MNCSKLVLHEEFHNISMEVVVLVKALNLQERQGIE